ncbi:lysine--tRNA ligase [Candidatus Woesearchaeota archaeon]|nr:lysine--tRNA ligase [Candidatus Woesearchaeota archaeon]
MDTEERIMQERKEKGEALRSEGTEIYPYAYDLNATSSEVRKVFEKLKPEEHESMRNSVKVAGRLMTVRLMGKASFATIQDEDGRLQLYFKQDNLGVENYKMFKQLDLGDFVGVEGSVFKTKTGEVTIEVKSFKLLCKSLRTLPEKYHGLKDPEIRHRKRYLDLIANPEVKKTFAQRSKAIREVRSYLNEQGYLEVETPVLQPQYGGAAARPFVTKHNALNMDLYLRISPEMYLKRLLIGGFTKVYDINKNFRNEGIDFDHNPEFTMIEWYEAYSDYNRMMDMCEEMIKRVALKVYGKQKFSFKDMEVDLSGTWERIPMTEALKKYGKVDVEKMNDQDLLKLAIEHEFDSRERTRGHLINFLFEKLVEDSLVQPTFIMDHPVEVSPLTKKHRSKPGFVERAELFMAKSEFANIYSELNDPVEQRTRLEEQETQREKDEENNYPMDEDFCEALEYGMPPAGGIGVGIDRLIMVLSENPNIREVILFPTLRPENK